MTDTPILKMGLLLVAAFLFLIAAFVTDPQKWWSFGFVLLALGLIADQLAAFVGTTRSGGPPRS